MILRIDRFTSISDIQAAFTGNFPFLKLEFIRSHSNTSKKETRVAGEPVLAAATIHENLEIEFDDQWKVSQLIDAFLQKAGLIVQVCRRSGNVWIETSLTDDWTLEQQNREGEQVSSFIPSTAADTVGS